MLLLDIPFDASIVPDILQNEDQDIDSSELSTCQAALCRQGKHDLFLDDELGMRCRYCSHIEFEIVDYCPSFVSCLVPCSHLWSLFSLKGLPVDSLSVVPVDLSFRRSFKCRTRVTTGIKILPTLMALRSNPLGAAMLIVSVPVLVGLCGT